MQKRPCIEKKKRIVVKIGSSSLTHEETGNIYFAKIEKLVRELCDLRNSGIDVCLVSSGAIAVGRQAIGLTNKPSSNSQKQACAAVGQARLMMTYQKVFAEYNQTVAQVLMTKNTMILPNSRQNAHNTFEELFAMGVIPIVNENDTVSTYEMQFGDNDTLSALVATLVNADLLVLLSDINGMYTDDPRENEYARLIEYVPELNDDVMQMGKDSTGSGVGTGGMHTKLNAAMIATRSGADMIITNSNDLNCLHHLFDNEYTGTLFAKNEQTDFLLEDFLKD
ncbi:glutamate 5-kinase [Eubacterium oxidoreducens]|uniref:Glutamate 5-kinase n=1 Tax=Eubacterium oxidoreducens TaxID=1732 RepID=A0A1G6AMZ3_EUBOX|nr:glutamate 5-kinase [Eubacterium oxidoreducens]SDB09730.1 glutamate 5-kinase [Eubacterium oxidoreducens]